MCVYVNHNTNQRKTKNSVTYGSFESEFLSALIKKT